MVPSTDASKENTCEATFALMRSQAPNSTCTLCPYYFHIITLLFLLFLLTQVLDL